MPYCSTPYPPEKYVEVALPVVRADPQCGALEDLAVQAFSLVPQRVVRPEGQPQLQQPRGAGERAAPLWLPAVSHLPPPTVSSVDVAAVVAAPAVVDLTREFRNSPSAAVCLSSKTDDGVETAAQFASKLQELLQPNLVQVTSLWASLILLNKLPRWMFVCLLLIHWLCSPSGGAVLRLVVHPHSSHAACHLKARDLTFLCPH